MWAATKPIKVKLDNWEEWMRHDDVPFQHFPRSGKPKHVQCTCVSCPGKYCWHCKAYAPKGVDFLQDNGPDIDLWD